MSAPKFEYWIEVFHIDKWLKIKSGSNQYCQGFYDAKMDSSPRLSMRIKRSDGEILEYAEAKTEVSIGMVAGWPTPEQYEAAAARAMAKAEAIRARVRAEEERRERRRQGLGQTTETTQSNIEPT